MIIKLPLPFKGITSPTNDLEFILSPANDGSIEIYNVSKNTHEIVEGQGHVTGVGNSISLSENQSWIVTGTYNGNLQIFEMKRSED